MKEETDYFSVMTVIKEKNITTILDNKQLFDKIFTKIMVSETRSQQKHLQIVLCWNVERNIPFIQLKTVMETKLVKPESSNSETMNSDLMCEMFCH